MDWWDRPLISGTRISGESTRVWRAGPNDTLTVLERFDGERWSRVHRDKLEEESRLPVKLHSDDYFLVVGGQLDTRLVVRLFGHSAFSARQVVGEEGLPTKKNPRPRPAPFIPRFRSYRMW